MEQTLKKAYLLTGSPALIEGLLMKRFWNLGLVRWKNSLLKVVLLQNL